MNCPVCKTAMITLQLEQVEVDYCLDCTGIWLDAGELEELLEDSENARQLLTSFIPAETSTEKPRKCPICLKKMQKVVIGKADKPLVIDKCKKHCGLWFDKDELQNILKLGSLDKHHKIQRLLADIFSQNID